MSVGSFNMQFSTLSHGHCIGCALCNSMLILWSQWINNGIFAVVKLPLIFRSSWRVMLHELMCCYLGCRHQPTADNRLSDNYKTRKTTYPDNLSMNNLAMGREGEHVTTIQSAAGSDQKDPVWGPVWKKRQVCLLPADCWPEPGFAADHCGKWVVCPL